MEEDEGLLTWVEIAELRAHLIRWPDEGFQLSARELARVIATLEHLIRLERAVAEVIRTGGNLRALVSEEREAEVWGWKTVRGKVVDAPLDCGPILSREDQSTGFAHVRYLFDLVEAREGDEVEIRVRKVEGD